MLRRIALEYLLYEESGATCWDTMIDVRKRPEWLKVLGVRLWSRVATPTPTPTTTPTPIPTANPNPDLNPSPTPHPSPTPTLSPTPNPLVQHGASVDAVDGGSPPLLLACQAGS